MGELGFFEKRRLKKRLAEFKEAAARILHVEDEILSPKAKDTLKGVVEEAGRTELKPAAVEAFASSAATRLELAFPRRSLFHSVRDWLDVIAVALAVAFGIRALYLQPFKIPTSSMQPTLFGIHYVNKDVIPNCGSFLDYWLFSARKVQAQTKNGGEAYYIGEKGGLMPTVSFGVGSETFTVPGSQKQLLDYLDGRRSFSPGETVCDGWLSLGDHLFVNRFGIHFLGLSRGDIVVFTTEGIEYQPQPLGGFYYIKRLVGLPGDTLKISGNVVYAKEKGASSFKPVYELSEKFRKLYSIKGGYQGHVPQLLLEEGRELEVPEGCYFMMGDNTTNSLDSRYWGFVPRHNIVGTAGLVFWPLSRRWGLADSAGPVDKPTALPRSMWLQ
jgi:signal peptidase I